MERCNCEIELEVIEQDNEIEVSSVTNAVILKGFSPYIHNGTWWEYDKESQTFVDTGVVAKGQTGEQGPIGPQGPAGEVPDLSSYVKNTDYAGGSVSGVVKTSNNYGVGTSANGYLQASIKSASQYESMSDNGIIGKGTLENVLADKGYATSDDIPTKTSDLTNDSGYITSADVDIYQVSGWMTGVPSGNWSFSVYKNGELCTEELYADIHYSPSVNAQPITKSSFSGSFVGTKSTYYSTAYKYLIEIYPDETKSKLLCSTYLNYGVTGKTPTDDHINELIDAKIGTLEPLADEINEVIGL